MQTFVGNYILTLFEVLLTDLCSFLHVEGATSPEGWKRSAHLEVLADVLKFLHPGAQATHDCTDD